MKNHVLKSLAMFIFSAAALTGCDELDSLGDVTLNEPITASITVDETGQAQNVTYTKSLEIDATTNAEIEKYSEKVKSIKVNKITFKIINYTGEASVTSSKVKYGATAAGPSAAVEIASLSNFDLKAAADAGTETELVVSDAHLQAIATLLKNDLALTVYLDGSLTKTPVKFTVEFNVDATIVASALGN